MSQDQKTGMDVMADVVWAKITEMLDQLDQKRRVQVLKAMAVRYRKDLEKMGAPA